jgi:hypothetical protein
VSDWLSQQTRHRRCADGATRQGHGPAGRRKLQHAAGRASFAFGRSTAVGATLRFAMLLLVACGSRSHLDLDVVGPGPASEGGLPSADSGLGGRDARVTLDSGVDGACRGMWSASNASNTPVNVLVVVDRSASMAETPSGFTASKWEALKNALRSTLEQLAGAVSFGLEIFPYVNADTQFPNPCGDNCCSLPPGAGSIEVDVAPGSTSVPQIEAILAAVQPGGGTPVSAALGAAREYFTTGRGRTLEGDRWVLLATDGAPNCNPDATCNGSACAQDEQAACGAAQACCAAPSGFSCIDEQTTVLRLSALEASGISTLVVGIPGNPFFSDNLNRFAEAGAAANPGQNTKYYPVRPPQGDQPIVEIQETLFSVHVDWSCDVFPFDMSADAGERGITVTIDGSIIPQATALDGGSSGWVYVPGASARIAFVGAICDTLRKGGVSNVTVAWGCSG